MRDHDRPLVPQGIAASVRVGEYLVGEGHAPQQLLCSTSARARQTLDGVMAALGQNIPARFIETLYLASAGELLHQIHGVDDSAASVLVVAHNPGIQQCALQLAGAGPQEMLQELILGYPTGSLVILHCNVPHWRGVAPGGCELLEFVQPKKLAG